MKEEEEGEREEEEGEREGERWVCKNWWRAPKNVSWSSPILLWMSQVQCKILPFSSFAHSFQNFEEKKKSMERTVLRRFFPIFLSSRPVIHHINFPKDFLSPPLSPLRSLRTHTLLTLPLTFPFASLLSLTIDRVHFLPPPTKSSSLLFPLSFNPPFFFTDSVPKDRIFEPRQHIFELQFQF